MFMFLKPFTTFLPWTYIMLDVMNYFLFAGC